MDQLVDIAALRPSDYEQLQLLADRLRVPLTRQWRRTLRWAGRALLATHADAVDAERIVLAAKEAGISTLVRPSHPTGQLEQFLTAHADALGTAAFIAASLGIFLKLFFFARAFRTGTDEQAMAAFASLRRPGIHGRELREIAVSISGDVRNSLALAMLSSLIEAGTNDAVTLVRTAAVLRILKGEVAAREWLLARLKTDDLYSTAREMYRQEQDPLLWDAIPEPMSTSSQEWVWLLRAASARTALYRRGAVSRTCSGGTWPDSQMKAASSRRRIEPRPPGRSGCERRQKGESTTPSRGTA